MATFFKSESEPKSVRPRLPAGVQRLALEVFKRAAKDARKPRGTVVGGIDIRQDARRFLVGEGNVLWFDVLGIDPQVFRKQWEESRVCL